MDTIYTHHDNSYQHLVKHVVRWTKGYAINRHKEYIRLDTAGHNQKLIKYYTQYGFTFLGNEALEDFYNLPLHYHHTPVCLFEMKV